MKILIACEESQAVTQAFRKRGFEAFSCDIVPTSGGRPEWHIQKDVREIMNSGEWRAMIAFPPCTHLAIGGARWWKQKQLDGRQQAGIDFFMEFVKCDIKYTAIENPVGIMSKAYRPPDQITEPWHFNDGYQKRTCLWLKNLPPLKQVCFEFIPQYTTFAGGTKRRPKWWYDTPRTSVARSRFPPGFSEQMAVQWGDYLKAEAH
jgi:hypothetical protein